MILTTTDNLPGKSYHVLGLVEGGTVQSTNIGKDLGAVFKNIVGGELKSYTEMMEEARDTSTQRMIDKAQSIGADAIIAIRYGSATITTSAAEVFCYGTAIKFD